MSQEHLELECVSAPRPLGFDVALKGPATDSLGWESDEALVAFPVADRFSSQACHGLLKEDGPGATSALVLVPGDSAAPPGLAVSGQAGVAAADEAGALEPWSPPRIGRLVMRDGFALMNSQILRSRVFQSPQLGRWLRALGDHSRFRLKVEGFSPSAWHYLVLLYAVSRMSGPPDPRLGAAVQFTTLQLINGLSWAYNVRSYARAARLIDELKRVRLTFRIDDGGGDETVVADAPLFACVTENRRKGQTYFWQVTLTPALLTLFGLHRNTLLEMRACRALHTTTAALWLYGFIASQTALQPKTFDVKELCRAAGLAAARDVDNRKALGKALTALQRGSALARSGRGRLPSTAYEPILAEWSMHKSDRGWRVTLSRSSAFVSAPPLGRRSHQS